MADLTRPRLLSVIGARPEIIQASPVSAAMAAHVDEILVHTGQHYDPEMSGLQIADLKLPTPDYNLGVGSLPDRKQIDATERGLVDLISDVQPDGVLVRGDTNATLAGARAAKHHDLPLFHVEAGLRSFRADMPEERNRIETDKLSDVLFPPSEGAKAQLEREGIEGIIHVVGDPLADVLLSTRAGLPPAAEAAPYILATVHRNYNTDDPERLKAVMGCLGSVDVKVIFPLHPRTAAALKRDSLTAPANVELRPPVTYSEMLMLERGAVAIATDSGGVQREAYNWAVPCITLREETEWVDTVSTGWNTLVGADAEAFRAAFAKPRPAEHPPIFGDGHAAEYIAAHVANHLASIHEEVSVA